jgi:hypothetical protein
LPRDLDRDSKAASGVVENKVELLVGRNDQVASGSKRTRHFDVHVPSYTGRTIRDGDSRICAVCDALSDYAAYSLFQQGAEVRIGSRTPSTGLLPGANKLNC